MAWFNKKKDGPTEKEKRQLTYEEIQKRFLDMIVNAQFSEIIIEKHDRFCEPSFDTVQNGLVEIWNSKNISFDNKRYNIKRIIEISGIGLSDENYRGILTQIAVNHYQSDMREVFQVLERIFGMPSNDVIQGVYYSILKEDNYFALESIITCEEYTKVKPCLPQWLVKEKSRKAIREANVSYHERIIKYQEFDFLPDTGSILEGQKRIMMSNISGRINDLEYFTKYTGMPIDKNILRNAIEYHRQRENKDVLAKLLLLSGNKELTEIPYKSN